MHSKDFIELINTASSSLGIESKSFSDDWSIMLRKNDLTRYIVGYTFPLNNSVSYKIARNKNLCSEILSINNVSNVPHKIIYSSALLERRKSSGGNFKAIFEFIEEYGYPFLIKKNDSTKGRGVYLIQNETQLGNILAQVSLTDVTFCLSPLRKKPREFRNVILDGVCLLSYEKHIPFVVGNGKHTLISLITNFLQHNGEVIKKTENAFDLNLMDKLTSIPLNGEKIFLHWKHNRFPGTKYTIVNNESMKRLAVNAALAINARFVCVDIIETLEHGLEMLEINASVAIHKPIIYPDSGGTFQGVMDIYKQALSAIF